MTNFVLTAKQIEALSGGHVVLKTINNWVAKNLWFSPIAAVSAPNPRLFSRMNAIEAVIASRMMMGGIAREKVKHLFIHMAANLRVSGYSSDLPGLLEKDPAFRPGSHGWFWAISYRVEGGEAVLDEVQQLASDSIGIWLSSTAGFAVIVPVSAIVASVDATTTEAKG